MFCVLRYFLFNSQFSFSAFFESSCSLFFAHAKLFGLHGFLRKLQVQRRRRRRKYLQAASEHISKWAVHRYCCGVQVDHQRGK